MNRFALTTVLLLSISSWMGCATLEIPYAPPGHACGWDPIFGSCDTCGTCGGACEGHTPASYIGHQLRCTAGCGDLYWGPWLDTPPDQCDPCDDCGNFVGDRCCAPKFRQKVWWAMTGQTGPSGHGKGCASCGGKSCTSCGGKGCSSCGEPGFSDVPYYEPGGPTVAPHEAPTPELLPGTPTPVAPARETPAFIRPAHGGSLSLPFQIRSARFSE